METQINKQITELSYEYASQERIQALSDGVFEFADILKKYMDTNTTYLDDLQKSIEKMHIINTFQSIAIALLSIALILHLIGG